MKHLNRLLGISLLVFALGSCEKKLDIPQHSVSSVDTFYQTDEEAEEAITAAYYKFYSMYNGFGTALPLVETFFGDDVWVGGSNHYEGTQYKIIELTFDSDLSMVESVFTNLYNTVYACNLVLENVTGDSAVMKRARAEALVIRAFCYYKLTAHWGNPPLVDHTLSPDEYLQTNSTPEELWAFVENDLIKAIESGALVQKSGVNDKIYRVTKQFAQALLGKAYIFDGKYAEAAKVLDEVIDSKLYDLAADYSTIGTPEGKMSCEGVFEFNQVYDLNNRDQNNSFLWIYRGLRGELYRQDPVIFAESTWGFQNPTKDLYDAFVSVEGVDGYRLNNTIITYDQLKNDYHVSLREGTPCPENEGFYNFKYRILNSNYSFFFYPNNIRVMRFAEVLLLAAEAHFLGGDKAKATDYINRLRDRAKAPRVQGTVTFDQIKTESRLELCFDGYRWENIVRWGDGPKLLKGHGAKTPSFSEKDGVVWTEYHKPEECGFIEGKHERWPYPANEIAVNPNIVQNPGW